MKNKPNGFDYAMGLCNGKAKERLERARQTNDDRDEYEREAGLAPPSSGGLDAYLRTAMGAIASGLSTIKGGDEDSLNCFAEALEMLADIHDRLVQQKSPTA